MSSPVIKVENLSKLYRLGEVGTGSLAHDINRWWHRVRGKEDPYALVGQVNDRTRRPEERRRETGDRGQETGGASQGAVDPSPAPRSPSPDSQSSTSTSNFNSELRSDYVWALKDVTFSVHQGEVLGIIGRNGAGKSTLLKILSRVTAPTTGSAKIKGRIASLLEVGTGFHHELTGRENVYLNGAILGMRKREIDGKLDEIVDFSGCAAYIDTPVKRYSSGMQVRLAFAVAAHLEPETLVIDEVLAVGDAEFQRRCLGKMQDISLNRGRTILFVSHQLVAVKALCPTCLLLEDGQLAKKGATCDIVDHYLRTNSVPTAGVEWPDILSAPGGPKARITAVEVVVDNERTARVPVNRDIKVRIFFAVLESGSRVHAAFHLCDRHGECVFAAANLPSTSGDASGLGGQPHRQGFYLASFSINAFLLNVGVYSITAFLATNITSPEAQAWNCLTFEVFETGEMSEECMDAWPGVLRPRLACSTTFLG